MKTFTISLRGKISEFGYRINNIKNTNFNEINAKVASNLEQNIQIYNPRKNDLAVLSMIRDENDVIDAWLENLKELDAQLFVVDHKSRLSTKKKLENFVRQQGGIYLNMSLDGYFQLEAMNYLLELACANLDDQTLILPLDADEFVGPRTVESARRLISKEKPCIALRWRNSYPVIATSSDSSISLHESVIRASESISPVWKSATFVEYARDRHLRWAQGNHLMHTRLGGWISPQFSDDSEILHIPIRSEAQLITKLETGIQEYIYRAKRDGNGFHWQEIRNELDSKDLQSSLEPLVASYGQKPSDSGTKPFFKEGHLDYFIE